MSGPAYFPFYPTDFIEGVRGMTAEQVGVYTLLLCAMYQDGGSIRDDARMIRQLAALSGQAWARIKAELIALGKLTVRQDGRLSNGRVIREIMRQSDRMESRRQAQSNGGKKSAARRAAAENAGKSPENPEILGPIRADNPLKSGDPGQVDSGLKTQRVETPVPTPESNEDRTNTHTPRVRAGARVGVKVPQGLNEFLRAYGPTAGDYTATLREYRAALEGGADPAELLAAVKVFPFRDGRFKTQPENWLRGQCWKLCQEAEPEESYEEIHAAAVAAYRERQELEARGGV
jgi:uncharacterized protein YdaU (DUF1376 family)